MNFWKRFGRWARPLFVFSVGFLGLGLLTARADPPEPAGSPKSPSGGPTVVLPELPGSSAPARTDLRSRLLPKLWPKKIDPQLIPVKPVVEAKPDGTGIQEKGRTSGGGWSSGGGNVLLQPHPVLMDFALYDPDFQEPAGAPLASSLMAKRLGYDRIPNVAELPEYKRASERLELWRKHSPVLMGMIADALKGMDWLYTPYAVEVLPGTRSASAPLSAVLAAAPSVSQAWPWFDREVFTELQQRWPEAQVANTAIYDTRVGARFALPIWNQLGERSRAGLLVHEALRHVQLAYESWLPDFNLYVITAVIMLVDPDDAPESLDNPDFFSGGLRSLIEDRLRPSATVRVCGPLASFRADFDELNRVMQAHPRFEADERAKFDALASALANLETKYCADLTRLLSHDELDAVGAQLREVLDSLYLTLRIVDDLVAKIAEWKKEGRTEAEISKLTIIEDAPEPLKEKVYKAGHLLTLDICTMQIEAAVGSIASRTHHYRDLTHKISADQRQWKALEQQLRTLIEDRGKGLSRQERKYLGELVERIERAHAEELRGGRLLK
ncbi:MAG: hypothetical protein AB7P04_08855 [Bacteriovoracia bacterium]